MREIVQYHRSLFYGNNLVQFHDGCYSDWNILLWKFWKSSLAPLDVYTLMLLRLEKNPCLILEHTEMLDNLDEEI